MKCKNRLKMPKKSMKSKNRLESKKFNETLNFHKSKAKQGRHGNNVGNSKNSLLTHPKNSLRRTRTQMRTSADNSKERRTGRPWHAVELCTGRGKDAGCWGLSRSSASSWQQLTREPVRCFKFWQIFLQFSFVNFGFVFLRLLCCCCCCCCCCGLFSFLFLSCEGLCFWRISQGYVWICGAAAAFETISWARQHLQGMCTNVCM